MQKDPHEINLVKNPGNNVVDRFINWALTAGRVIVIITEVVALSAFLYRFSLDRKLIDLHTLITQEQNIVKYSKRYEDIYRNLQDRIAFASTLSAAASQQNKMFTDILSLSSQGILLTSFTLSDTTIKIEGRATSVNALATFVNALRRYPGIDTVSIDTIENSPSSGTITVKITAMLQKKGGINGTVKN